MMLLTKVARIPLLRLTISPWNYRSRCTLPAGVIVPGVGSAAGFITLGDTKTALLGAGIPDCTNAVSRDCPAGERPRRQRRKH